MYIMSWYNMLNDESKVNKCCVMYQRATAAAEAAGGHTRD